MQGESLMSNFEVDIPFQLAGYEMTVKRHPRGRSHFEYGANVREIGGSCVGGGVFLADAGGRGFFEDIYVSPSHRRRGIATAIYYGFEAAGLSIRPAAYQDEDGVLFWMDRLRRLRGDDTEFNFTIGR
jgi:GNAT superfamily N-acetyltransferase